MVLLFCQLALAHDPLQDPFRQLDEILPTPNPIRTASGRPGSNYWQQQADYVISVELDEKRQTITGYETITYTNNSPDSLSYLWLQLDQNIFAKDSIGRQKRKSGAMKSMTYKSMQRMLDREQFDGGFNITKVEDSNKAAMDHTIVDTMMRIALPTPLESGQELQFSVGWNYQINDSSVLWGRTGFEYFEEDKNHIFEIAHWYPRMVSYTDVHGWHHKQFIGSGEFTLEFGNYDVEITVPADHIVAATGTLENPQDVLTKKQKKRFNKAKSANEPMFVVTPGEAKRNQIKKQKKTKTWKFKAENVRDFAFASSRKFIWDAWGRQIAGKTVMAMSFYPNEAEPLWSTYSTHAIAHTLEVYSRLLFPYPYPTCISVNGPVYGMEFPMISFNGPRPLEDGTYYGNTGPNEPWKHNKYALISVIIHEVGHNWFPMIINSDERSWTWMDEGLNTFVQHLAELEWEEEYPSRRGYPHKITNYMKSSYQVPIMTDSESLLQFGNNGYAKPATALNILRETILGPQNFDFAFQQYAKTWRFKRPTPADFFRIMEDAAGVDLDWFWQGWFYSTQHVDLGVKSVRKYKMRPINPKAAKPLKKKQEEEKAKKGQHPAEKRAKNTSKYVDSFPELLDFYNEYDQYAVTDEEIRAYEKQLDKLSASEKSLLKDKHHYTIVEFENVGGLVSPILGTLTFVDGAQEEFRIPVDIWRRKSTTAAKLFITKKEIAMVILDLGAETADTNTENDRYPPEMPVQYFDLKNKEPYPVNPMQKKQQKEAEERQEQ